jgi:hypothetical protein
MRKMMRLWMVYLLKKSGASFSNIRPEPRNKGHRRRSPGSTLMRSLKWHASMNLSSRSFTAFLIFFAPPQKRSSRTRELPGHYPFVVQARFIKDIVEKWRIPVLHLCKTVVGLVLEHLQELVSKHFEHIGQGHLAHRVKSVDFGILFIERLTSLSSYILLQHMKRCQGEAEARVEWLLQLESSPFSLNTHYLSDYRAKFLAYYKAAREKYETSDLIKHIDSHNSSTLNAHPSTVRYSSGQATQPTGIAKVLLDCRKLVYPGSRPKTWPICCRPIAWPLPLKLWQKSGHTSKVNQFPHYARITP